MRYQLLAVLALSASPIWAEGARQLGSHEHGVGVLNIAVADTIVEMEFHAPGADLVGFEYAAETEADRAAVDGALAVLARPLDLFALPSQAACRVVDTHASLEREEEEDDHETHDDHADHDHEHDHQEHDHQGHEHEEHAEHDDHGEHSEAGLHTEFHAHYVFNCSAPDALTSLDFNYFDHFANARVLEVQIVSASGAKAFEVHRADPKLDLQGMF